MADWATTYGAVRGALVAAIENAWSPVTITMEPFEMLNDYTGGYPVVFVNREVTGGLNETPLTDEKTIRFDIVGVFASDDTQGNDLASADRITELQAELYAATNLGNYGYLGLMGGGEYIDFEGSEYYGVSIDYTCNVSITR